MMLSVRTFLSIPKIGFIVTTIYYYVYYYHYFYKKNQEYLSIIECTLSTDNITLFASHVNGLYLDYMEKIAS